MTKRVFSMKRTRARRRYFYLMGDTVCIAFSVYLAFLLRFDWSVPGVYNLLLYIPTMVVIKLFVFWLFKLHDMSWTYTGPHEVVTIAKANIVASAVIFLLIHVINPGKLFAGFPRSIFVADFVLSVFFITGFRLLKRFYLHHTRGSFASGKRTLIVGAGDAGASLVRDMSGGGDTTLSPVGFIDDDKGKQGVDIHGIKVLGKTTNIPELVERLGIESILIAIPSASNKAVQRIMEEIRKTTVRDIRVVPGLKRILDSTVRVSDIKELAIEDILGRDQAAVDAESIGRMLRDKVVLVTGAGGSIGSEVVRQAITYGPKNVIALDIDEADLFNLQQELIESFKGEHFLPVVADIRDREKYSLGL